LALSPASLQHVPHDQENGGFVNGVLIQEVSNHERSVRVYLLRPNARE